MTDAEGPMPAGVGGTSPSHTAPSEGPLVRAALTLLPSAPVPCQVTGAGGSKGSGSSPWGRVALPGSWVLSSHSVVPGKRPAVLPALGPVGSQSGPDGGATGRRGHVVGGRVPPRRPRLPCCVRVLLWTGGGEAGGLARGGPPAVRRWGGEAKFTPGESLLSPLPAPSVCTCRFWPCLDAPCLCPAAAPTGEGSPPAL